MDLKTFQPGFEIWACQVFPTYMLSRWETLLSILLSLFYITRSQWKTTWFILFTVVNHNIESSISFYRSHLRHYCLHFSLFLLLCILTIVLLYSSLSFPSQSSKERCIWFLKSICLYFVGILCGGYFMLIYKNTVQPNTRV